MLENTESRGDLLVGILAGLVAALISAVVWAAIPFLTDHEYGVVAIALGAFVGFAVRWGGRGSSMTFGVVGAACAVLAIAIGNVFAVIAFVLRDYNVTLAEVLAILDFETIWQVLSADFTVIDGLFYLFAIYEGFRFAIVPGARAVTAPQTPPA
ncbi:MAG TPA: hypothetical protein VFA01_05375 [Candidatus Dormibacteraeota bacterium]|nr:hypothetical protein [Candidatus Dormibacteraeota bacterium]